MTHRPVLTALLLTTMLAGCGGTSTSADQGPTEAESLRNDTNIQRLNEGIDGDAACHQLFWLRNALVGIDTSQIIDPELREIGCLSATSERTDKPSPTTSAPETPTTTNHSSTTSQSSTTSRSSTAEFARFLQSSLARTSYSIDSLTSPYGKAQIQAHTYFAESICKDLRSGRNEDELRAIRAREEVMGDPSLDKDIPKYVDAIFEAAKTYVCP